ncbi:hypothetical protein NLI96_g8971 [Meripilus lineatus]|uniref:Superoxide dismutase [Cu-Zn] n=1 Tax=Meripilus lineatus TaxID=2056292 RepID=A0AAD5YBH6_9APHY|nr:hypothetical protein NLI96_g8971 [Physisporinus lineatus]
MDFGQRSQVKRSPLIPGAIASVAVLFVLWFMFAPSRPAPVVTKAVTVLRGDSGITGTVTFEQSGPGKYVTVTGDIKGLDPSQQRGFHVHASGDLSGGCISAGAHFNPFGKNHGAPDDIDRHVGDLGNIAADEYGNAKFTFEDRLISLNGETSILGRSIVLHAGTDDLGKGGDAESLKTGNAGARAACGVIGIA